MFWLFPIKIPIPIQEKLRISNPNVLKSTVSLKTKIETNTLIGIVRLFITANEIVDTFLRRNSIRKNRLHLVKYLDTVARVSDHKKEKYLRNLSY